MPYKDKKKALKYRRDHYKANTALYKDRATKRNRLVKYGLTEEAFQALVQIQNGRCGICRLPPEEAGITKTTLHVDHDHATGRVRGLLCNNCNTGLGLFRDSIDRLQSACNYLKGMV